MRFIMRFGLRLPRRDPRRPLVGQHDLAQVGQRSSPLDGRQVQPAFDDLGVTEPGLRAPPAVCVRDGAQEIAIEAIVAAMVGDVILDRFIGQSHQLPDLRFNRRTRTKRGQCLRRARAGLEIFDGTALAEPPAEALDVADQRLVGGGFRVGHEVGEGAPHQLLLRPAFDRLETGHDPRFRRKCGEQPLGEAVDRLDLEAARAIQHPRDAIGPHTAVDVTGEIPAAALQHEPERRDAAALLGLPALVADFDQPLVQHAALVKVRHRIDSGRAPFSNRRSTRAVRTCVFPVPADADSAACTTGSDASACSPFSSGRVRNRAFMRLPMRRATP